MTIPYLLGVFLVFLFNQAPEFVLVGIFIGGTIVQAMFFTTVLGTTLLKSLVFGTILFIGLLGVTLLAKSIDGINSLTYEIFPLDTTTDKVLRVIALYAFLCMMIWELIHYFINSVMMKTVDRRAKKEVLQAYEEPEDDANLIDDKDVWKDLK